MKTHDKNYFKIGLPNIGRNKVSSVINIAGLAIGITCVIFILFYVQDELGYDKFFKQSDRIYQVNIEGNMGGQEYLNGTMPPPAGTALTSLQTIKAAVDNPVKSLRTG